LFVALGVAQAQTPSPAGNNSQQQQQPPSSSAAAPSSGASGSAAGADSFKPKTVEDEDLARFLERDVNQDGWLSGSETNGIRHYDADGNGEITRDEFIAGRAAERVLLRDGSVVPEDIDLFSGLDTTGSGYISGVDIERGNVASFDTDQNGRVTRKEFYQGRARLRREIEERAAAAREADARRRLTAGEPEPPPPLGEEIKPKRGMMRGRVLTPDGKPVPKFTMEVRGYNIDAKDPRIDGRDLSAPNFEGRFEGREGYYEIRLPDGSFGFAATIIIPGANGPKSYPLRATGDRQTIDYIEVQRASEGVVKNLIWDPAAGEIKSRSTP
jgi:hypothetical protein